MAMNMNSPRSTHMDGMALNSPRLNSPRLNSPRSPRADGEPVEPKDAPWLGQLVRRALHDDLAAVQAELAEIRVAVSGLSAPRCSESPAPSCDQPLGHSNGFLQSRVLPPIQMRQSMSQTLPGMVLDNGRRSPEDLQRPPQPAAPRESVPPHQRVVPQAARRAPRGSMESSSCVTWDEGVQVVETIEVLNGGTIKRAANDVKRRQTQFGRASRRVVGHGWTMPFHLSRDTAADWMRKLRGLGRSQSFDAGVSNLRSSCLNAMVPRGCNLADARKWALWIVQSAIFEMAVCFTLVINAVFIGLEADRSASREAPVDSYAALDALFCVIFSLELSLRLFAFRTQFFKFGEWWNYFDLVVVTLQIVEEIAIASVGTQRNVIGADMSGMRVLRVLRLLRILRVLRVIRFVSELKKVVYLIIGSLPSFFWAMVLLTLLIYVLAVFFTQLVADSYLPQVEAEGTVAAEHWQALTRFFGSTLTSALTLYKAVSGGVDWEEISNPVIEYISPLVGIIFIMYSLFAVLVLLNLVTGVFVDGAMRLSRADKEIDLFEKASKLLRNSDEDGTGGDITWPDFKSRLSSPEMCSFFEALEISTSRAGDLFHIIDRSGDGKLSLAELVAGGLMLQGPAKAIDVAALNKYMQASVESLREDIRSLVSGDTAASWGAY